MATKKRMGGMKLSDFGSPTAQETDEPAAIAQPVVTEPPTRAAKSTRPKAKPKQEERLVTVNIKIKESQQEWLTDTAKQVRQNNDVPVPASDRVYPQHLIQTAIDLLQSSEVDWANVRNIEDLRQALNL